MPVAGGDAAGGFGEHHGQRGGGIEEVGGRDAAHRLRDAVAIAIIRVAGCADSTQPVGCVIHVGVRAIVGQVAVGVVDPDGLRAVAGAAGIRIDAGNLVGAVDDVADGVDGVGGGVPLVEAGQVARAIVFVVELVARASPGDIVPAIGAGVGDAREAIVLVMPAVSALGGAD